LQIRDLSEFFYGEQGDVDNIGPLRTIESVDVIFENMKKTAEFLQDMDNDLAAMQTIVDGDLEGSTGRRTLLLGSTDEEQDPEPGRPAPDDLKQETMDMIKNEMAAMQIEIAETNVVIRESTSAALAKNSEEMKKELKGEMAKMMKEQESRIIQGILKAAGMFLVDGDEKKS
jgi:hypothetical protein